MTEIRRFLTELWKDKRGLMTEIRRFLTELRKDKRGLMTGVLVAVTVAFMGWGVAFGSMVGSGEMEDRLASAEAELSETRVVLARRVDELAAVGLEYRKYQDMSGNLEKVTGDLAGAKAELADLLLQIDEAEARLDQQRAEAKEQQTLLAGTARDYVTTIRAKVRARPTTASEELAILPEGTPLAVFEIVEKGLWYKVGSVGFMHHELLKPVSSEEAITSYERQPEIPWVWHTINNNVLAYSEIGGKGKSVKMPGYVDLELVRQQGDWAVFTYDARAGVRGQGWFLMRDVERKP